MKFSIEKSDLLQNIQHLHNIVPSKNTMPILTNYLIEANEKTNILKFSTTDLQISVITEFAANIIEGGKIAVSARNLNEIILSLPNSLVNFILKENTLEIICQHSKFNLLCAEASQFPLIPEVDVSNAIELNAKMFKKMIDNTHFAVSTESNRPIFTGIYWKMESDCQLMVATDGKKIAEFKLQKQVDIPESIEQIIPTKGLLFIDKVISDDIPKIGVLIEANRVMFTYGNYTIFTHIIEGDFPNYHKAIPNENTNILKIKTSIFKEVIKRTSLLASEETFKIKLNLDNEKFIVYAMKRDEGEAKEEIEDFDYNGEPIEIAFNFRYLLAILNVIETELIEIRMGKRTEPALFFNVNGHEDYTARFLLMPLRLV